MGYVKYESTSTEYQGESFAKSIQKENNATWDANDTAEYEMTDSSGTVVSSGSLTKSGDSLSFALFVPNTDTASLEGIHLLLVYLTNSVDATISDVIAEYRINYKSKKAK